MSNFDVVPLQVWHYKQMLELCFKQKGFGWSPFELLACNISTKKVSTKQKASFSRLDFRHYSQCCKCKTYEEDHPIVDRMRSLVPPLIYWSPTWKSTGLASTYQHWPFPQLFASCIMGTLNMDRSHSHSPLDNREQESLWRSVRHPTSLATTIRPRNTFMLFDINWGIARL